MRRAMVLAIVIGLLMSWGAARADEAAEARAILDRALQAMGGIAKVEKLQGITWKGKGTIEAEGKKAEVSGEVSAQGDEHFRLSLQIEADGRSVDAVLVVTPKNAWARAENRKTEEAPKEFHAIALTDLRVLRLGGWLAPLRDNAYQLSPLGELKINDRAAVGIKAAHKDRPDLDIFFDKETKLPIRCEVRLKEPTAPQEVLYAFYFADWKEAKGVKHYTRLTIHREDKKLFEIELSEIKPEEKLDEGVFAKP
jgi:hypothetical protein